jgi:hypothetical protein
VIFSRRRAADRGVHVDHAFLTPVWIAEVIWGVLPSRIMLPIAGEENRISIAATRPPPSFGISCCATTGAQRLAEHGAEPLLLARRKHADDAVAGLGGVVGVQACPNTIVPFSAAASAIWIVSRSRISPTRIRSGSSRPADLSASENDVACAPISRWWIRHFLFGCTNSIGSSIVMMW